MWRRFNRIICGALFIGLGFGASYAQKIQVIDNDQEAITDVEVYVYKNYRGIQYISDGNGIVRTTDLQTSDSIVCIHTSYKKRVLTYTELVQNHFKIVLELRTSFQPTFYWRHDPESKLQEQQSTKILLIRPKEVKLYNPQTTADLLGMNNQIFIQKSQMGGGSPMIRGFAANNVLIVVDGVRMNNAIFRDGNLQNVISIDPHIIQNTQILFGPTSVMYGSDAMGGVMAFQTRTPHIDTAGYYRGNVMLRTSTANRENSWHVDLSYGKKRWAGLSSISLSNYGELRMGSNGPEEYTRPNFSEFNGRRDTVIENDDVNIQYFTSYSQVNVNQKLRYQLDSLNDFILHFGFATTSPIPRYDRLLQTDRNGNPRFGDWYYGPQKWFNSNLRYVRKFKKTTLAEKAITTVSYQRFNESRFVRRFNTFNLEQTEDAVDVTSVNLDLDKRIKRTDLVYGAEYVANVVHSMSQGSQIDSGFNFAIPTRYPDNSTLNSAAGYVSAKINAHKSLLLNLGARYSHIWLHAPFTNNFYQFPFEKIELNKGAFSGTIGLRLNIHKRATIYANIASGFRAPNIDDIGKVFDSQPDRVIVPNPNLNPEYSYNGELGFHIKTKNGIAFQINGFYTVIDQVIVRGDYQIDGRDSLFFNGEMMRIQSLINVDQGIVKGLEAQIKVPISKDFEIQSSYNIITGEANTGQPLRHVTPNFGNTTIQYKYKKLTSQLYANYNGALSNDQLAPSEQSKVHMYALDDNGLPYAPAWWTLNLKGGYSFSKTLQLNIGIENVLNKRYRPYSSGVSAPGRNLIISLYGKF